jgi:hypothetical protein
MLFRETVAVYCENHTEHTDTLCRENAVYINPVRTSQEIHYVSITKANRLMLLWETVAVHCDNRMEHLNTLCGQNAEFLFWLQSRWYKQPLCFKRLISFLVCSQLPS